MKISLLLCVVMICCVTLVQAQESVLILSDDYDPYTSSHQQGSGVMLDLVRQAFAAKGIEVTYEFAPWKRCEQMVAKGEAFGAAPYFKTEERLQHYNFSDPIIYSINKFFYNTEKFPNGFTWNTLEDFQGYSMGGILGYWYIPAFERAGLTVEKVESDKQNLAKLIAQRIDFTVIDELTGMLLLRQHFPDDMHKIGVLDKPESFLEFHVMISRTYPKTAEFTDQLNQGLKQLKESGEYHTILKKHHISTDFAVP
jgi:polar amino acid transport system substrate-binding protein